MFKLFFIGGVLLQSVQAATLDYPQPYTVVNGVHAITGARCSWENINLDNEQLTLFTRNASINDTCDKNGQEFVYVMNFSDLELGEHTLSTDDKSLNVVFYVTVKTLTNVNKQNLQVYGFPNQGITSTIAWDEIHQGFILQDVEPFIQLDYVPKLGEIALFRGTTNMNSKQHKIVVLSYTDAWYTKPFYQYPDTFIDDNGRFEVDIHTGNGQSDQATQIAFFLVKHNYVTPIIKGQKSIPQSLKNKSIFKLIINR